MQVVQIIMGQIHLPLVGIPPIEVDLFAAAPFFAMAQPRKGRRRIRLAAFGEHNGVGGGGFAHRDGNGGFPGHRRRVANGHILRGQPGHRHRRRGGALFQRHIIGHRIRPEVFQRFVTQHHLVQLQNHRNRNAAGHGLSIHRYRRGDGGGAGAHRTHHTVGIHRRHGGIRALICHGRLLQIVKAVVIHRRRQGGMDHLVWVRGVQHDRVPLQRHLRQPASELSIHMEGGFQRRRFVRRRPHKQRIGTLIVHIVLFVLVPEIAIRQIHLQRHRFGFACFQAHLIKCFQLFQRAFHPIRLRRNHIQLHRLASIHTAGVGDLHRGGQRIVGRESLVGRHRGQRGLAGRRPQNQQRIAGGDGIVLIRIRGLTLRIGQRQLAGGRLQHHQRICHAHRAVTIHIAQLAAAALHLQVLISIGRIAEPVSKRIGLLALIILIGPAGFAADSANFIIRNLRQLLIFGVPGERQLGGRIGDTIQHPRHCVALRLSVAASPQNGSSAVLNLLQLHQPDGLQIRDGARIQTGSGIDQRALIRGQRNTGAIRSLARAITIQTHHHRVRLADRFLLRFRKGHILLHIVKRDVQIFDFVSAQIADGTIKILINLPSAGLRGFHRCQLHPAGGIHRHGHRAGAHRLVTRELEGHRGQSLDVHIFEHQRRPRHNIAHIVGALQPAFFQILRHRRFQRYGRSVRLVQQNIFQITDIGTAHAAGGAALDISDIGAQIFHALNRGGGVGGSGGAGIVAQHHLVRNLADHHDLFLLRPIQRQHPVVFQQHDRIIRRILRQLFVRRILHLPVIRVFRAAIRHHIRRIKLASAHPPREGTGQRHIQRILGQNALLDRVQCIRAVHIAAVHITARQQAKIHRFLRCNRPIHAVRFPFVVRIHIADRPAIGGDIPVKPEGPSQQRIQQIGVSRTGNAVHRVICAHHRSHTRLLHNSFECAGIILPQHCVLHIRAGGIAPFFAVVGSIVLDGGDGLIIGSIIALHTIHKCRTDLRGQKRVLTIRFVVAAPSRVARHVDGRRPIGQPLPFAVVVSARLVRNRRRDLFDQRRIPAGRHADGIRKRGRLAGSRHTVQRLRPEIVAGHTQPPDRRRGVRHMTDLFLQRHSRHQVGGAFLKRIPSGRIHINHRVSIGGGAVRHPYRCGAAHRQHHRQRTGQRSCSPSLHLAASSQPLYLGLFSTIVYKNFLSAVYSLFAMHQLFFAFFSVPIDF